MDTRTAAKLQAQLGDIACSLDRGELDRASKATFATAGTVAAVVSPRSEAEVRSVIEILNDLKLPFHCRSGHANWGYGSRNSRNGPSVLVSLANLKTINVLDAELGLIHIEPGVTVQELQNFVGRELPHCTVSGPASSGQASVVGNLLDRGIGVGMDANRSKHLLSVRAVLPDGQLVDTARTTGTERDCHTAVLGPDASGLFLQSNLGVVTAIRLRLHRPWSQNWSYCGRFGRHELSDRVAELTKMLAGWPRASAALFAPGRLALEQHGVPADAPWTVCVNFEANSRIAALRSVGRLFRGFGLGAVSRVRRPDAARSGRSDLNILYGPFGPADRRRRNPDLDGVGLIFTNAILPLHAQTLDESITELQDIFDKHSLPLALSVRLLGPYDARFIIPVVWDRSDPCSEENALAAQRAVAEWQAQRGVQPYRLSTLDAEPSVLSPLISLLKRALDPNDLLDGATDAAGEPSILPHSIR